MPRNQRLLLLIATSIALTGLAAYMENSRDDFPPQEEFPVRGIDVSHYQGSINWEELKKEDIKFVFIKATEGSGYKDPKFAVNWANAKKNGFTAGAYHYFRLCKNGASQAGNYIATVPKSSGQLPPVVDLEFIGNCKTEWSKEPLLKEIEAYISQVKAHYGQPPIIYSMKEFYDTYLHNQFTECPLWIRDTEKKPELSDKRKWTFWQCSNTGRVKGINGPVDLNVFNGSSVEFQKLIHAQ